MGLFGKKYDFEKDCLRAVFDLETKQYVPYHGIKIIPYKALNKKSKQILDRKNYILSVHDVLMELEVERAITAKRYQKLKSMGYVCQSFEYLGEVRGTMSKEMEQYLNSLISEEDVLLGIHRVGGYITEEKIEDILTNGLKMTAHLSSGAQSTPALGDNVGYYPNNKTIIKELMHANAYKNSKGSILIRIPDEDLTKDIFIKEGNIIKLNPKYILGYVPLYPNNHIENIIKVSDLKKTVENYEPIESYEENIYYDLIDEEPSRGGR